MQIANAVSTLSDTRLACREAYNELVQKLGAPPSWMTVHATSKHDGQALADTLRDIAPDIAYQGGTSCQGIMTESGFHSADGLALGLFGILDPHGRYTVVGAEFDGDPRHQAAALIGKALQHGGIMPALIWITSAPGQEESLIAGIESAFTRFTLPPIIGGSSADNDINGDWYQLANGSVFRNGWVAALLYPSTPIHFAFDSSYDPTAHSGIVSKCSGRTLHEINRRPAAEVYNEWTGCSIADKLDGGQILEQSTFFPLGREVVHSRNITAYQPSHPAAVTAQGAITLFTEIQLGERITLLKNSSSNLVDGVDRVTTKALKGVERGGIAGALVVYCAGCMMAVRGRMPEVAARFSEALGGRPFLGIHTFGEQGCAVPSENTHANLMMSVLIFEQPS